MSQKNGLRSFLGRFGVIRALYRIWKLRDRVTTVFRLLRLYGVITTIRLYRSALGCWRNGSPVNDRIRGLILRMGEKQMPGSADAPGWLYHDYALPEHGLKAHRKNTDRRLRLIKKHVTVPHASVLDIGCSSGGMTTGMALLGASRAVGVDYDPAAIAMGNAMKDKYGLCNVRFDCADFMNYEVPQADIILWLSNWMWIVKAHGLDAGKKMMFDVPTKAETSVMVFESGASDKSAPIVGTTQKHIEEFVRAWSPFSEVKNIGPFDDHWSAKGEQPRNVLICKKPGRRWEGYQSRVERIDAWTVRKTYKEKFKWARDWEIRCLEKLKNNARFPRVRNQGDGWIELNWAGHAARGTDDLSQLTTIVKDLKAAGIVHRDIRPGNLLWQEGMLTLVDFGWAWIGNEKPPIDAPDYLGDGFYAPGEWDDAKAAEKVRAVMSGK